MRTWTRAAVLGALVALGPAPAAAQSGGPVITLDAGVTGTFDRNIRRDATELDGYGGAGELLLRLASAVSRPLLQLEYATSFRRTSEVNPADGTGHRVSALAGVPLARWSRLNLLGRAGRGGVDEDLVATNEIVVLGRMDIVPGSRSRLRPYGAQRWREPPPGTPPTIERYAGLELRQQIGGSTSLLLDARYETSLPPDTTRFWERGGVTVGVAQHLAPHTAFELEVRRRRRLYPQRLIDVQGEVVTRRDDDWNFGLALVYDDDHGTEVRLEAEHDDRLSNDAGRSYDASRVNVTVRRRVFGQGGLLAPPRIEERAVTEALRAHAEFARAPGFTAIAVAGTGVCALAEGRAAVCWPVQPGARSTSAPATLPGSWTQIAAGPGRACALDRKGAAYCWSWQEGAASHATSAAVTPPQPVRTELRFTTITVGSEHACGLTREGVAYCWGDNGEGQLGTGTALPSTPPVRVVSNVPFRSITAGGRHTCALTPTDAVYCWGANESSQSAAGALPRSLLPRRIEGFSFRAVSAGSRHTCALTSDGHVWCWGENARGQAGQEGGGQVVQPWMVVAPATFTAIGAGWAHSCALDTRGAVWCWGRNSHGQLGTGRADDESHSAPQPVTADRRFMALAVSFRSCALDDSQTMFCWGSGVTSVEETPLAPAPLEPWPRR